jgi:membrane-associated phospholipid phosphatase
MKLSLVNFLFFVNFVYAQSWDLRTVENINKNRYVKADKSLDALASSADYSALALPVFTLGTAFIKNDADLKKKGLDFLISTGGTYAVGYILKKSIDRARPYEVNPMIQNYRIENDASMPSGSTASAFTTAANLSIAFKKWYIVVPAYVYAGSIAYSRLHLGVHYPTDVVAGAALGTGSAILTRYVNKAIRNGVRKRKAKQNE